MAGVQHGLGGKGVRRGGGAFLLVALQRRGVNVPHAVFLDHAHLPQVDAFAQGVVLVDDSAHRHHAGNVVRCARDGREIPADGRAVGQHLAEELLRHRVRATLDAAAPRRGRQVDHLADGVVLPQREEGMQLCVALLGVIHRRRGGRGRGIGRVRRGQVDIEVIARCTPLLHLAGLIRLRGVLIVRRVRRQCADEADDRRRRQQKRQHQPRVGRDQLADPHRGDARHRADEDDPLHRRPREDHAQNEENRQHAEHQYFGNRIPRDFPARRRLHPEAAAPRRGVHALTVGGVLRVLLLRRQIRFLRILLAVPLLIVRRIRLLIPLLLVGLLIPAGLHKPLLPIRLLLIRLLTVRLLRPARGRTAVAGPAMRAWSPSGATSDGPPSACVGLPIRSVPRFWPGMSARLLPFR